MPDRRHRRALRELYAALNAELFDGRLPHAQRGALAFGGGDPRARGLNVRRVGVDPFTRGLRSQSATGFVFGLFQPPRDFWPAVIRVLSPLGAARERQCLLHEMVHADLWFRGLTDAGHGPLFVAELERLAIAGEPWASTEIERYVRHEAPA